MLKPFEPETSDFYEPEKLRAWLTGGEAAYPHLLCGHFVFSRDETVAKATSAHELATALQSLGTNRKLVGDFQGNWNLPALYLDAYADAVGTDNLASAIPTSGAALDSAALAGLKRVGNVCRASCDVCLDNTYHDAPDLAVNRFAFEDAGALIGYSERLHHVLSSRADARAFADFLTRDEVLQFVLLSEDTDEEVSPRLERILSEAVPFPTGGLYERRKDLKPPDLDAARRPDRS